MYDRNLLNRKVFGAMCLVVVTASSGEPLVQPTIEFNVQGPAAQSGAEGRFGDGIMASVKYPDTDEIFSMIVVATSISQFTYEGGTNSCAVVTGEACTVGEPGWFKIEDEDGDPSSISEEDTVKFTDRIFGAFSNPNLNSLLTNAGDSRFSFVVGFQRPLNDNDPAIDDFGELLFFERGTGAGNSWITVQAVTPDGAALGPAISINPDTTVPTSPETYIGLPSDPHRVDQTIGARAIDLNRLGVETLTHLKVMTPVVGVAGFTGGPTDPDFKVLGLVTTPPRPTAAEIFD